MQDRVIADYHTHTIFSHGRGTPEENVLAAIHAGLSMVAISEHGPGSAFFGVRGEKLLRLRRQIDDLNRRYGDRIRVLMGLEANLLADGVCDLPEEWKLFDVLLMGYHRAVLPRDATMWRAGLTRSIVTPKDQVRVAEAIVHALERYPIDIISHPGEYLPIHLPTLAKGAARLGVALEINDKHPSMSVEQMQQAADLGVVFVINSDAHRSENVGKIGRAWEAAQRAGVLDRVANRANAPETLAQGLRLREARGLV